jgi:hypothetical protein
MRIFSADRHQYQIALLSTKSNRGDGIMFATWLRSWFLKSAAPRRSAPRRSGRTKIGVFRPSVGTWFLSAGNTNFMSPPDTMIQFGMASDAPVVGNWL